MRAARSVLAGPAAGLLLAMAPASLAGEVKFTDVTASAGLHFRHDPGGCARHPFRLPEIMGSGGALLDYDGDGDLDIYLVQADGANRLFRQDVGGRFVDVSAAAGVADTGYGMGVAVGDVDDDGLVDLYVTNHGPDRLYRNQGGRRFQDVTAAAGLGDDGWSSSGVFCDHDGDGDLDLYVARYVRDDPEHRCRQVDGALDYCSPSVFPAVGDLLYRNDGGGRFTDVSRAAGIAAAPLPGLGVVCADLDSDGRLDFLVANDGRVNQLWLNRGDGRFEEGAFFTGLALNAMGRAEAGMGVAPGDVDGDGDLDLFLTHLRDETNTLYLNDGPAGYRDASAPAGLGAASLRRTGFGTGFLDLDHDGDLDLAVANGRVARSGGVAAGWQAYAEPNLLFRNDGRGHFQDISGGAFEGPTEISRGLALGDVDADGDIDLLLTNTAGPARLLRNDSDKGGGWLLVRALGRHRRADAHGARITVVTAEGRLVRGSDPGYGYLTSHDPRAHFGLPWPGPVQRIEVRWPDGALEVFPGGPPDRVLQLRRGEGLGL